MGSRGDAEDSRLLQPLEVRVLDPHALVVAARLKGYLPCVGQRAIDEHSDAIETAEGRHCSYLAVGKDRGELVLSSKAYILRPQLGPGPFHVCLAAGGEHQHRHLAVDHRHDHLRDPLAGNVLGGRQVLRRVGHLMLFQLEAHTVGCQVLLQLLSATHLRLLPPLPPVHPGVHLRANRHKERGVGSQPSPRLRTGPPPARPARYDQKVKDTTIASCNGCSTFSLALPGPQSRSRGRRWRVIHTCGWTLVSACASASVPFPDARRDGLVSITYTVVR